MSGEGRRELKYIIHEDQRDTVLHLARNAVSADKHAGVLTDYISDGFRGPDGALAKGYRVNTLYIDTPDLRTYTQRLRSAHIRNVVRIRTYGEPGDVTPVFIESKRKLRDRVVKHRALVCNAPEWAAADPVHPWETILPSLEGPLGRKAQRWLEHTRRDKLDTVLTVHYVREVYTEGRSRLTIDHLVTATGKQDPTFLQGPGLTRLIPQGFLVLELKFDIRKPTWMRTICSELNLVEEPVSKYGLGVAHTVRAHREGERKYITPPTLSRSGRAA